MTSDTLSELYRADIQVVKVHGRYVVVGEHIDHSGHTSGHSHE
jgi:zinc/manganese transport system ATP-binding protein